MTDQRKNDSESNKKTTLPEGGVEQNKPVMQEDTASSDAAPTSDVVSEEQNDEPHKTQGDHEQATSKLKTSQENLDGRVMNKKTSGRKALVLLYVLFVLFVGVTCAAGYLGYKTLLDIDVRSQSYPEQIEKVSRQSHTLIDQQAQTLQQQYQNDIDAIQSRLRSSEQRLEAQNKRLLSMSTTSREDWLLAEAEYLLKLGNQRVVVERNAESAVALFEEADTILRDLADPDLFPLREAIRQDLLALKLSEAIDTEGLFLGLSALAKQVEKLPLVPESFSYEVKDLEASDSAQAKTSWQKFVGALQKYYRIIEHDERPTAILPPDATVYLQLNLRFMIERAQLAVLREQPTIYKQSLVEAEHWVTRYFPSSKAANAYREELINLQAKKVISPLPDVTDSLELLNGYIESLHKLKPVTPSADAIDPPSSNNATNPDEAL